MRPMHKNDGRGNRRLLCLVTKGASGSQATGCCALGDDGNTTGHAAIDLHAREHAAVGVHANISRGLVAVALYRRIDPNSTCRVRLQW